MITRIVARHKSFPFVIRRKLRKLHTLKRAVKKRSGKMEENMKFKFANNNCAQNESVKSCKNTAGNPKE